MITIHPLALAILPLFFLMGYFTGNIFGIRQFRRKIISENDKWKEGLEKDVIKSMTELDGMLTKATSKIKQQEDYINDQIIKLEKIINNQ